MTEQTKTERTGSQAAPSPKAKSEKPPKRGFLRSNLEAFTVAIVMALVIKTYAFEAFQVPTESMEPTIIGRTPGGDRIIVNKFTMLVQEPERWEVLVFRYPLSRMVNYVKRLVGMPGESLLIDHGDLYIAPDGGDDFAVARKSPALANAIFLENPVIPEDEAENISSNTVRRWWDVPDHVSILPEGVIRIEAGAAATMVQTKEPITPARHDSYASGRAGKGDEAVQEPVSDLRLDLTVTPEKGARAVVMELVDGTWPGHPIRLELAVAGSDAETRLLHGSEEVNGSELKAVRLEPGEEVDLRLENYDDRIRVEIDGDEVASYDYVQPYRDRAAAAQSQVRFGLTGGTATVSALGVYRDIYYTLYEPDKARFDIPEGHYLFFGDNSPNSLDARGWRVVGIRLREDGTVLLGDLEAVSDSFEWPRRSNNPYFETDKLPNGQPGAITDDSVHHFLDIFGNDWELASGSYDVLDLTAFKDLDGPQIMKLHQRELPDPEPGQIGVEAVTTPRLKELVHQQHAFKAYSRLMHYVARDDIMGHAYFVFWPPGRMGVIR